jgi:hypothetical protein
MSAFIFRIRCEIPRWKQRGGCRGAPVLVDGNSIRQSEGQSSSSDCRRENELSGRLLAAQAHDSHLPCCRTPIARHVMIVSSHCQPECLPLIVVFTSQHKTTLLWAADGVSAKDKSELSV